MSGGDVQLRLAAELPVDPLELTALSILDRAALYAELELSAEQREVAEEAVRRVLRREYLRRPAR